MSAPHTCTTPGSSRWLALTNVLERDDPDLADMISLLDRDGIQHCLMPPEGGPAVLWRQVSADFAVRILGTHRNHVYRGLLNHDPRRKEGPDANAA